MDRRLRGRPGQRAGDRHPRARWPGDHPLVQPVRRPRQRLGHEPELRVVPARGREPGHRGGRSLRDAELRGRQAETACGRARLSGRHAQQLAGRRGRRRPPVSGGGRARGRLLPEPVELPFERHAGEVRHLGLEMPVVRRCGVGIVGRGAFRILREPVLLAGRPRQPERHHHLGLHGPVVHGQRREPDLGPLPGRRGAAHLRHRFEPQRPGTVDADGELPGRAGLVQPAAPRASAVRPAPPRATR